jgi:hypothetical protein
VIAIGWASSTARTVVGCIERYKIRPVPEHFSQVIPQPGRIVGLELIAALSVLHFFRRRPDEPLPLGVAVSFARSAGELVDLPQALPQVAASAFRSSILAMPLGPHAQGFNRELSGKNLRNSGQVALMFFRTCGSCVDVRSGFQNHEEPKMKTPNNQPETAEQQASREALEKAVRENLSPEGVAAIIAFLQPATMHRPPTEQGKQALVELEWFADVLLNVLGVEEHNRLIDEIGL